MRKIIRENLDSFCEKDLKQYSNILNRYLKKTWQFGFVVLITSCSVQNQISKDDFKVVPKNLSVKFYDKLDTLKNNYNNDVFTRSLIKDFAKIESIDYSKPIQLIIKKNELFLKFNDTYKKQYVLKFFGKRFRRKFVFYTNYETVTFPMVFMKKDMTKYSIYYTNNNEIIIEKNDLSEVVLLIFGAGHSLEKNYKFKIIKNE
ncbi:MAG: hypothetical protein V4548_08570 [Bacteroidota bacterium]